MSIEKARELNSAYEEIGQIIIKLRKKHKLFGLSDTLQHNLDCIKALAELEDCELVPAPLNLTPEMKKLVDDSYCEWKEEQDYDDKHYSTSCGEDFCFIEGDIKENNCVYCHKCGKKIREVVEAK